MQKLTLMSVLFFGLVVGMVLVLFGLRSERVDGVSLNLWFDRYDFCGWRGMCGFEVSVFFYVVERDGR